MGSNVERIWYKLFWSLEQDRTMIRLQVYQSHKFYYRVIVIDVSILGKAVELSLPKSGWHRVPTTAEHSTVFDQRMTRDLRRRNSNHSVSLASPGIALVWALDYFRDGQGRHGWSGIRALCTPWIWFSWVSIGLLSSDACDMRGNRNYNMTGEAGVIIFWTSMQCVARVEQLDVILDLLQSLKKTNTLPEWESAHFLI